MHSFQNAEARSRKGLFLCALASLRSKQNQNAEFGIAWALKNLPMQGDLEGLPIP